MLVVLNSCLWLAVTDFPVDRSLFYLSLSVSDKLQRLNLIVHLSCHLTIVEGYI